MTSFASLGGALSIMSGAADEESAVDLLAEKGTAELVILAKTAASLHAHALFRAICRALFRGRTAAQVRESLGLADDLTPGSAAPGANDGNEPIRDLTETLPAERVLPLLPWADLDVACQVCRRSREWATPEMDRRVAEAMADPAFGKVKKKGADPSFTDARSSVAALAQARGRLGADGAPQRIDLSGLQLGAAGWGGIIAAIRGSAELAELNLAGCAIPKACYALFAEFFDSCPALRHVDTTKAADDGEAEGWVFALWRLHLQQLDQPQAVVHTRDEIFLLNVHLDAPEWERILAKMVGSPSLERLILTMCWIPHSCAATLTEVFTSCPRLSALRGGKVDTCWAADDQLEFGWVDTLYTQCSGGEAHGDGSVAPAEEVPLAALGAAARSPSRVAQDPAMMQLRARRLEMES